MDTTAPLPEELRTYLTYCSNETVDEIVHTIRTLRHNAPLPMITQPGSRAGKAKAVKKQQRVKTVKPKVAGVSGGPKRPLNSWMAYRKYYNSSLAPLTQKAISKILMTWWHVEFFTAKWAIIAKAYSVLRGGREKDEAPLDFFLSLAVPLMGIIPPEQYQDLMGWKVTAPAEGDQTQSPQVTRLFTPDLSQFDDKYTTTTMSVDDLVAYCMRSGYLSDGHIQAPTSDAHGALTMAVQPTVTATPSIMRPAALELTQLTIAENGAITAPLSPFSMVLAYQLTNETMTQRHEPVASDSLTAATTAVTEAGSYPYTNLFDLTTEFDISFNPNAETAGLEDGGLFDAFDPSTNMSIDEMLAVDWTQFVNDDGMA